MTPAVAASMPASRKNCQGRSPGSSAAAGAVVAAVFDPRGERELALSSDRSPVEGSIEVAELIVQSRSERGLVSAGHSGDGHRLPGPARPANGEHAREHQPKGPDGVRERPGEP